jgi:DNA mismatch endonuclease, patch repair protein
MDGEALKSGRPRKLMSPRLSLTQRMARIRKTDTQPELLVRRAVHALGYRFRLHRRDLPGCPDLVLPRHPKEIFVHGCFWHRHDCRDGRKLPNSKPEYWGPKLARNAARDARHRQALATLGWDVLEVWECEIKDEKRLARVLKGFLAGLSGASAGEPMPIRSSHIEAPVGETFRSTRRS